MFRRLIMAILRLYMNHLVSSYTNIYIYIYIYIHMGYLYGEGGGGACVDGVCMCVFV